MAVLSSLRPRKGATHARKRSGRGDGSGLGGTAGKGHKGQRARTGGRVRRGFEGGQTPLMRRLPKFGFSRAQFDIPVAIVNLDQLEKLSGEITPETLRASGLVREERVKLLGRGKLTKALTVRVHQVSSTAKAAVEAAGGRVEVIA